MDAEGKKAYSELVGRVPNLGTPSKQPQEVYANESGLYSLVARGSHGAQGSGAKFDGPKTRETQLGARSSGLGARVPGGLETQLGARSSGGLELGARSSGLGGEA